MLGTPVNKNLYNFIGHKVILNDPKTGPIEVEVKDIVNGQVLYEAEVDGNLGSIDATLFEKLRDKNV